MITHSNKQCFKMRAQEKIDKALLGCYTELYANSIGLDGKAGDFDKLISEATIDEKGQKSIPFMDYYIPEEKFQEIVEKYQKQIPRLFRRAFSTTVNLGQTPMSNKESWEERK